MNKGIHKYINNCALCKRAKTRTQVYPLQMTGILDRPFDKIAIDLVSDLSVSASGNQHILTIIDHLIRWPEAFPIPDKKADTTDHDNGRELKNQLMDNILQQLGIGCIFSVPYHPQSNGKLEVFTNTLTYS